MPERWRRRGWRERLPINAEVGPQKVLKAAFCLPPCLDGPNSPRLQRQRVAHLHTQSSSSSSMWHQRSICILTLDPLFVIRFFCCVWRGTFCNRSSMPKVAACQQQQQQHRRRRLQRRLNKVQTLWQHWQHAHSHTGQQQ